MTDAERRQNATDSFSLAVQACRENYLRNRIGNETAAEYFARRSAPAVTYPVVTLDHIGGPIRLTIHAETTITTELTPAKAVSIGAELCALGAAALTNGR